mgnify:CR=1 FL=1
MRTVVFAYHEMGIVGLESLKREGFEIEAIFSHRDDPQEKIWFRSVAKWASDHRIEIFFPENVNDPFWVEKIAAMKPRMLFSFYYRSLLGKKILSLPPLGAYNLHGSLLPAYRGRSPVNWVLVNGETRTGVTLHHMVEKADAGDIVSQMEVPIEFEDTAFTLYRKLCAKAGALLHEILPRLKNGTAPRLPQDPAQASYFGRRTPQDGKIDWRWPALRIYNLIRAVTDPYPGAFAFLPEGEKLWIWWAKPQETPPSVTLTGTVEIEDEKVYARAGSGRLRLLDVEVTHQRLGGQSLFQYFRPRKGMVLR